MNKQMQTEHEKKLEAANRVLEIREEIRELLDEAKLLARHGVDSQNTFANLEAYVFDQIEERLEKGNPYNQDLHDVAKAILGLDQEQE